QSRSARSRVAESSVPLTVRANFGHVPARGGETPTTGSVLRPIVERPLALGIAADLEPGHVFLVQESRERRGDLRHRPRPVRTDGDDTKSIRPVAAGDRRLQV